MTISPALFPAVTVTVVRDRKIRITLRTNQIAGFVTVPFWKKNKIMSFITAISDLAIKMFSFVFYFYPLTKKSYPEDVRTAR